MDCNAIFIRSLAFITSLSNTFLLTSFLANEIFNCFSNFSIPLELKKSLTEAYFPLIPKESPTPVPFLT